MNAWGTAFRTRLHKASCCGGCRTGTPIVPPTPNRDPGEDAAQRRVAGHLETEIAYFLQRNRGQTRHGTDTDPIAGRIVGALLKPPTRFSNEEREHEQRRPAHEQATFTSQLQVVVVSLGEMFRRVGGLKKQHRLAEGVQSGAGNRKRSGDGPPVAPDGRTAAQAGALELVESGGQ